MRICLAILCTFLSIGCPSPANPSREEAISDIFLTWYMIGGGQRALFPCGFEGVDYIRIQPGQTINLTKFQTRFTGCVATPLWTVTATPALGQHLQLYLWQCDPRVASTPGAIIDNGTNNPATLTGSTSCVPDTGFAIAVDFIGGSPAGTLQFN